VKRRLLIETDVECITRDGTVLRADIYRPDDDGQYPALLLRTPYGKQVPAYTHASLDPVRAALHGYVVIIQDTRGRFASGGEEFVPYRDEFADGFDAAQWAAALPFCDGQVGAYGVSYMGGAAWQMAVSAPPALRAISPTQTANDQFENVMWRGGAFMWGTHLVWSLGALAPLQLVRSRAADPAMPAAFAALVGAVDDFDALARHLPPVSLPAADPQDPFLPYFYDAMRHLTRDEFHASRSIAGRHRCISVPALIIAGWYDVLLGSDLQHFAAMQTDAATEIARDQTRLVIGPWAHGTFATGVGDQEFGMRASGMLLDLKEDLTHLQLRWFDRWTKGGTQDPEPRVKVFVQGVNRWRDEDGWPPESMEPSPWFLRAGGGLTEQPPADDDEPQSFVYDPLDPCPTRGGSFLLPRPYAAGPIDQTPIMNRPDVLVYRSEPLRADLTLIGPVRAILFAATSGPDTDWVVKLCRVEPTGRTLNLCDGILRASFRDRDWSRPLPVTPHQVLRYEVDLWATAVVIAPGERLCVLITSSDFPRYDRNPNTGVAGVEAREMRPARQWIHVDRSRPSQIVLPHIP
jgi:uncharacterized protein